MKMRRLALAFYLFMILVLTGVAAEMKFPGAEWDEAAPESQGVNSTKLEAAIRGLEQNAGGDGVKELVIARNGVMIWRGDDIDKKHGVWSMTKSFTSTCLGLLIDDGKTSLDAYAKTYIPEMSETYPDLTLRHFAAMTSGYRAVGDTTEGSYKHGPSRTPFLPNPKPLFDPPGSAYAYWDSAMNQFAHVLTRIAGEPLERLFKRRIADPIGMDSTMWNWGDFGEINGLVVNGGSGNNSNHIFITARQGARFGHLFLNRGNWNGKQLISSEWIDAVHQVHVPNTVTNAFPDSGIDGPGMYGLNWWVNGVKPNGKHKWPDAPLETYSASGYNNNDLFVIPEWKMVIVRLGLDQRDNALSDSDYNAFLKGVGEALME